MVYVCGGQNAREKKKRKERKEKGNVWMKERQRIRNDSGLSNDFQTWLSAKPYNSKHSCQRALSSR